MKGWDYAIKNQAEAVKIVLENDTTGAQTEHHQAQMMGEIAKLVADQPKGIGYLEEADYQRTVNVLLKGSSDPVITKQPVRRLDARRLGQGDEEVAADAGATTKGRREPPLFCCLALSPKCLIRRRHVRCRWHKAFRRFVSYLRHSPKAKPLIQKDSGCGIRIPRP